MSITQFDREYYLVQNPDVSISGIDPETHFNTVGFNEGRNPNAFFDVSYYLSQNPDVAAAGVNPFNHFVQNGADEGRSFSPLFDTAFYARQNPDVAAAGLNAVQHFLLFGADENRSPNAFFDTAYYLAQNPDVAAAGLNAFEHFQSFGFSENRNPSEFFDVAFYKSQNADVAASGLNALEHFINFGIQELRDPNASFDLSALSSANSTFANAIANGSTEVFQKIVEDAAEIVQEGGTNAQALTVATASSGTTGEPPVVTTPVVPVTPVVPPVSGGGGVSTPTSALNMTEVGSALTIAGTSTGSAAFTLNLNSFAADDNGLLLQLSTGSYANVTSVNASGVTNIGLNLQSVLSGVTTAVVGTGQVDTINGGSAADTITGGVGADIITTGTGADVVVNDGSTGGIDIVTDFTGATDVLSSALAASAFNYTSSTFRLLDASSSTHGWQFTNAAGTTNTTGLHQQEFDVTNAGAGGGKFMSEINNSAGITGSTAADLLVLAGTTSAKTADGGNGADRILDDSSNANTLTGGAGNDTLNGGSGADSLTGGADSDVFVSDFNDDGMDDLADFSSADDSFSITLAAGALTYDVTTNQLRSSADSAQGFDFAGSTGLDDVNINETNAGAGGGIIRSIVDNSTSVTGGAASDLIVYAGTTSAKIAAGAGGADHLLDVSANANDLRGEAGNDTLNGGSGADTLTGGADSDTFVSDFNDDGLDFVTDFTGADDSLSITLAASSLTYLAATNALVSNSANAQGFRFTDSSGSDNTTGLDDVEFSEVNAGAGGGSILSEINNSAGLTGTTSGDFLYFAGTTSSKTASGGNGADRILDDTSNANTLTGGEGADTLDSGAGADSIVLTETTPAADTVNFTVPGALNATANADTITDFATTSDKLSFDGITITGGGAIAATSGTAVNSTTNITAGALTDDTVYVISDGGNSLVAAGSETITTYTSLSDVADYLNEGYNATADNDAAIFVINDVAGTVSYVYLFDEQTSGASTIQAADLALIAIVNELNDAVLVAGDIA